MVKRIACVAAAMLLTAPAALGQSGGLVLYENGSPDMGIAYAGAGARAQDAATAFTNPAGMTRLEGNHLLLGVMVVFTDIELKLDAPGTISNPPGSLDGGGELNQFAPGLGSFGVMSINDRLKFGFSVGALSANGVEYDRSWIGSTFVLENQFVAANFQPGLAFRLDDQWSLGASLNIVYASLEQELLLSTTPGGPTIEIDDADDIAFGGTFGVMFEASEQTRFGLTYRTEFEFDLDGEIDVQLPVTIAFDSTLVFAQGANLSVYHELNDRVSLLADVGWSDWSAFDRQPTSVGPFSAVIVRDWKDTWRLGLGVQWHPDEAWTLSTGVSYDSSPVDDDKRLPDIPVGEQFRFSLGAQHDFGQGKVFGISYTLLYSPMDMDSVQLPGGIVLDGEYDPSMVHLIGMSYSISF